MPLICAHGRAGSARITSGRLAQAVQAVVARRRPGRASTISSNAGITGRPGLLYGVRLLRAACAAACVGRADPEHAELVVLGRAVVGDHPVARQDDAPAARQLGRLRLVGARAAAAADRRDRPDEQQEHDARDRQRGTRRRRYISLARRPRDDGVLVARASGSVPSARTLRGDPAEIVEEAGIRDGGGLDASHLDALARRQPGDRSQHREPVVAGRVERAAAQPSRALDREAVRARLDLARRAPRRPSTTVAIRSDSLWRSSSAPATTVVALGERAEQRDQRQLVDQQRHLRRARPSWPRRAAWRTTSSRDRLAARHRCVLDLDAARPSARAPRSSPCGSGSRRRPRARSSRARHERRGHDQERGRREVARHATSSELEALRRAAP